MGNVAGADRAILGGDSGNGGIETGQVVAEGGEELIEVGALPAGDVVNLVESSWVAGQQSLLIGLDNVVDIGEVA